MPKILTCPECSKKLKQLKDEELWCTGKTSPDSVGHKKIRKMV